MWKMIKKQAALWMALCLAVTAVPMPAWADQKDSVADGGLKQEARAEAEGGEESGVTWELSPEGVLTIRGSGIAGSGNWEKEQVKSVVVEEGVTEIADRIFSGCGSLTSVTLPEGLTSIGSDAFSDCKSLHGVEIPAEVAGIGDGAFYNCESLTSVTLPEGLTSIGQAAFGYCESLTNVMLPEKITSIEKNLFLGCGSLSNVEIPTGVTSIGECAFYKCENLEGVTFPENLVSIGRDAFSGCQSLTSVTFPENLVSIGSYAFSYCGSLSDVEIQEGVMSIGAQAFTYCKSLTGITLPDGLTSIGNGTFSYCESLTGVTLPEGLTSIGVGAFYGCDSLVNVIFPEGLASIEDHAFSNCSSLISVFLPENLASIGDGNFLESFNITLYCSPDSYGEIYARENNIPFSFTTNSKIARITVTEENGTPVTIGFLVKWYADGKLVGAGNAVSVAGVAESLTCKVELSENGVFTYYQPKEQAVDLESVNLNLVCKLKRIPSVTLSGKVTDDGGSAISGASVLLTQTADAEHVRTKEIRADENGLFSAEILDLPTTAQISANGYFQRVAEAILEPSGSDVNLGTVILSKLPENKITLSLSMTKAAAEGDKSPVMSLSNGNGLEFAVYNETKGRPVSEFVTQYPYLILGEGEADGNDALTITVTDKKRRMTALPARLTLDMQKMGTAEISFIQNGFLEASLQGELPALLMLFDESGNFAAKKMSTSDAVSSEELPEGAYKAVFMQKTSLLEGAPQLSKLSGYGLSEGKDYVLKPVTIRNGMITRLGAVKVPKLDESLLYYTDGASTSMTANKQSVTVGDYVMLRAEYEMKPEYADAAEQSVVIEIPDGAQFVENSVTVNGKAANYTYGEGKVFTRTGAAGGIVRCYVVLAEAVEIDIGAELSFLLDGEEKTQPLGMAHVSGERMKLSVSERTSKKNVTVTGKTMPGSRVTVYDNGVKTGETMSNAAGNWSLAFDLVRPFYYTYHDISAAVENDRLEQTVYSDTSTVIYDQNYMDVSKVTMYNTGDNGENVTVFDFIHPGQQGSYRMWPGRYTDFTFVIEFTGNASRAENVVLNVISKSGQTRPYDADYDAVKDAWVVNTNFYNYNDAPVNVGVEYSCKEAGHANYSALSHPDAKKYAREYAAAADNVLEDLADIKIKEDTEEKLVLSYSPAGSEAEAWTMEIRELDYALFHTDQLESQGFSKCEADNPQEKPQYFKSEVKEGGIIFTLVDEEEQYAFSYTIPVNFLQPEEQESREIAMFASDLPDINEAAEHAFKMIINGMPSGIGEFIASIEYQCLRNKLAEQNIHSMNRTSDIQKLMAKECGDGSLSLPKDIWTEAQKRYASIQATDFATHSWLESDLEIYQRKIWNSLAFTVVTLGFGKIIKAGGGIGKTVRVLKNSKNAKYTKYVIRSKKVRENLDDWLEAAWDIFDEFGEEMGGPVGEFYDAMDLSSSQYWEDIQSGYDELNKMYDALEQYIRSNMRCKPKEDPKSDGKKGPDADKTPILDPSGYVCEAVPSNRLEGVTATVYGLRDQKDSFGEPTGEKEEYLWNAQDYDQANPILTDAGGVYMWDVPEGEWRIKYEKEGYETAWSEWLPVPPPQTEAHAALVSHAAPRVETVNVYRDNVKITFSQYMDLESVNTDNITVFADGQKVSGSLTACDSEESFADPSVSYARTFQYALDQKLSGEAEVSVTDVLNYAGARMEEPFSVRKEAAEEPKAIETEDCVEIACHSEEKVTLQVLPKEAAGGLTVTAKSVSPSIVSSKERRVTLDAEGKAQIALSGNLPGGGEILLAVDGTDIEKKITVRVQPLKSPEGQKKQCGKVSASVAGGSTVAKGTKVTLSVETEGADIYYTLDGTCPCAVNSLSRMKYTAPVEIKEDMLLIAYAVKEGYEDGVTSAFSYRVKAGQSDPRDPIQQENKLKKGDVFTGKDKTLNYKVLKEAGKKNPGTVSVIGTKKKKSKISIPSIVKTPSTGESFYVVSVEPKAFKDNTKVTRVAVGDQVETIGGSAFYGCKKLGNVTLGKKVSKIGDKAFYCCTKLKKITIKSKNLKKIGKNAIYDIAKNAVIKVPAKQKKTYNKKLNKKTGRKSTMKVVK